MSERIGTVFLALLLSAIVCSAEHQQSPHQANFGAVHFPISCVPSVQKEFERGVALLHSFAFETAETTFRQVAQDDPECAMAHWGIARSFWRWSTPDSKIREEGWREAVFAASLNPPTKREKEYIAAVSALYGNPEANGVTVVGVSIDEDDQAYHKFLKQYNVNFVTVRDPSQRVEHMYGTLQIPETYIIDRTGILRRKVVNSADWDSPEMLEYLRSL